jgi:Chitobiase/beta-hexosaminidase C-terminal domain
VRRRRLIALAAPAVIALATVLGALAYYTSTGSGPAAASVGLLSAPSNVTAPATAGPTVHVSWTRATLSNGSAPDGYYVTRIRNSDSATANACGTSPTALTTAAACDDTVAAAGAYHYTVTAVYRSWTATSASSGTVTVDVSAPTASIAFPADAATYGATAFAGGCAPTGICGSAADATGVQTVRVSIRRSADGTYWNGTTFAGATEVFNNATLASPGATATTWSYAFARPPDGAYVVHVQAVDAVGNAQTGITYAASASFSVDTTAPSVALTKVNGNAASFPYRLNQDVTSIGGTCGTASGDAGSVSWSVGSASGVATCTSGTWTSGSFAAIAAEGTYTAQASQTDTVGNTGSATGTVTIDKTAPAVAVTTVNGTARTFPYATNQSITSIGGTCGTATGDQTAISWSLSTQSGTVTCSGGTWSSGTFGTAVSADGVYTAHAGQSDAAGNAATSDRSVRVDKTAPSVSLALASSPTGASLTGSTLYFKSDATGSFRLVATVADSGSGPASATFPALSATAWTHANETVTTPAGGPYTSAAFQWTSGAATPGAYGVTGADAVGNSGAAASLTFTPDTTAPATTDNSASIGSTCTNTTQTVTLTPSDAGSGVAATYYTTDGSTPTTASSQGTSVTLSTDGTYQVKYFSVDKVGNQEAVKTASAVCIDKTAPAPTNVVLANGGLGLAGTANAGDTLTLTYSETLDARTFCSTWTNSGSQTLSGSAVVVQIADTGSDDTLTVTAVGSANCGGTANFKLGSVKLGGDYVAPTRTFSGSGGSLVWSPTAHTLTITLGTASGLTNLLVSAGTPTYTPDAALRDIAGNGIVTTAFSPSGTSRF